MYQIQFKNYKISPQKLQDQWKAIWNPPNSCGASSPRATTTSDERVHAPPQAMPGNGWIWPAFFFSSLLCRLWGSSLPATKEKTQQQVLIPCPSRFLDLLPHTDLFFFLVASPSSLFQAADFDVRASGLWSADSAVLWFLAVALAILELTVALGCCCGADGAVRLREDWEEDNGGCRCVRPEEERNRYRAGLLCQWAAALVWQREGDRLCGFLGESRGGRRALVFSKGGVANWFREEKRIKKDGSDNFHVDELSLRFICVPPFSKSFEFSPFSQFFFHCRLIFIREGWLGHNHISPSTLCFFF